eukprot:m51a1_g10384 hypothetical protein (150) ;mRNA; r:76712-77161
MSRSVLLAVAAALVCTACARPILASLRTAHGLYVTAQPGGVIAANRSTVGDCEKFWIESSRRVLRKLTLRTCYNTYVGVDTEGRVSANRLQEAQLESFVINWPNPHQTICSFRTHLGTFLGAPDDSGHTLVGDSPAALANELFNMKLED